MNKSLLVCLVLVMAACSKNEYDTMRSEFILGCEQSGVEASACNCGFDKIEEKYSQDELLAMHRSGRFSPDFLESSTQAMVVCINHP